MLLPFLMLCICKGWSTVKTTKTVTAQALVGFMATCVEVPSKWNPASLGRFEKQVQDIGSPTKNKGLWCNVFHDDLHHQRWKEVGCFHPCLFVYMLLAKSKIFHVG